MLDEGLNTVSAFYAGRVIVLIAAVVVALAAGTAVSVNHRC